MHDKPWLKNYHPDTKQTVDTSEFQNLSEYIESQLIKYSDRTAFECMGKGISYAETQDLSTKFAAYLQSLGLRKGDRIAIQMPNVLQYPIALFAALKAGLVVVGTNPLYTEREMEHQFKDSGAKALVVVSNFASKVEAVIKNTEIKHVIITDLGDLLSFPKSAIVNFVVKRIKKMVPPYNLPSAIPFKKALEIGATKKFVPTDINHEDLAFLQYTGGTTGVSKGAMLTHKNMIANMLQAYEWMKVGLNDSGITVISPLPLYHIFSLTVNCMTKLRFGAKNVLITNPRDMSGFIKELSKQKIGFLTGVNTLFNGMLNHPKFKDLDFSHLKATVAGGMALQTAVAERWKAVTGTPIHEGYGLTETSPVTHCNPLVKGGEQIGTIGMPFPSTEVEIRDENGAEVAVGERGEVCIRGPQVMKGYWKRDDETAKVFYDDGFLKTGDIGIMKEDGYFKIVDRLKDMICISGFNVYPNEVEDVISQHPKVLEVAAVGVADPKTTEAVKVFIVKKEDSLTKEEVTTFCKENLTAYKIPKQIEFRDELPKSNVGKILRRLLKDS